MSEFSFGGVTFPLANDADPDPSLTVALAYYEHCIITYVGDALVDALQEQGIDVTSAVESTATWDPEDYLNSTHLKFPMLAMYRRRTDFTDRTVVKRQDTTQFELAYVLPPLTASQANAILPYLAAIRGIIDNRTESASDPTYTPPGGALGDAVWTTSDAVLINSATFGKYQGTGELIFPAIVFNLTIKEHSLTTTTDIAFEGGDHTVALAQQLQSQGPDIDVAHETYSYDMELVSISPTTGPIAGGTAVTLTGVAFGAESTVTFGELQALDVVVVNSTTITCVTPPFTFANDADVTVFNRHAQSSTLAGEFSYT